jgi:Tellurite resistance protein TerB/zinc-ribbon family
MLLIIIYGWRSVSSPVDTGTFHCPHCHMERTFVRKSARRYFSLYFIPLIPLDHLGEYVECQTCLHQYGKDAIDDYQEVQREKLEAKTQEEYNEYVKRMMVLMALAEGDVSDAKIDAIRTSYEEVSGTAMSRREVDREFYLVRLAKTGMAPYSRSFEGILEEKGKVALIQSVYKVATADGPMGENSQKFLDQVAAEIDVTPTHLRQILYGIASA